MLNPLPISTDIPPYGADEDTEHAWQWFHAVCQLVAAQLAELPRGTVALQDDGDPVYWLTEHDGYRYLATAPTFEGEIAIGSAALVRDLAGLGVDELAYLRQGLEHWLHTQTTMRIGDVRLLRVAPVSRNEMDQ
ncbi:hypothetical protein JHS3_00790 [Jeongeupia sp. HS-3]|uniref:hypothetical protein n=1 Tax=Jeongeupia sp. HS-3 TaxID=1009682 RepID=UPI0018A494AC|nr:hypothetical protein [Jeongeupia sp. HS-3]BCL74343.1 hypothetical protein JHS3_00790 [Jeongeupia sp. HS-3]